MRPAPHLHVTTAGAHDARIQAITIRAWHPRTWWVVAKAVLRYCGVLPRLCPRCGGQGRLIRGGGRFLRRQPCDTCRGSGRQARRCELFRRTA